MQALQGRVAGLDITQASGQPGEGPKLQLRGTRLRILLSQRIFHSLHSQHMMMHAVQVIQEKQA